MKKLALLAVLVAFGSTASPALGLPSRTWVSNDTALGDDANPCSRSAPCRTFPGAISKTEIGGEINVLDPGAYGTLTITKSITIDGGDNFAGVLASGTNGFTIDIPSNPNDPNRRVVLRNLSIDGTGLSGTVGHNTGLVGVNIIDDGAATVELKNLSIFNFTRHGIKVFPTAGPTGALNLTMDNVVVADTAEGSPGNAVEIAPGASHSVNALIRNSELKGSRAPGGAPAGTAGAGLIADSGAHVWLTGTGVFNNDLGLQTHSTLGSAGVIDSFCDNQIVGNADNGTPPNDLCPQPQPPPPPQIITQEVPIKVCVVPKLKGLPTSFAKKLLGAANCALGKVTKKKVRKRSQVGKVLSQKTRAGTTHAQGTKVAVTVGRR
jgi:hypothetical protein